MTTFLFFAVFISLFLLLLRLITNVVRGRSIVPPLRGILLLVAGYVLLWGICYCVRQDKLVPLGADNCFDDWCVSVVGADASVEPQGRLVRLYVKLSSRRRFKPVELRVMLMDDQGRSWERSLQGATELVFDVPKDATGLKARFDKGPKWVGWLLLPVGRKVIVLP